MCCVIHSQLSSCGRSLDRVGFSMIWLAGSHFPLSSARWRSYLLAGILSFLNYLVPAHEVVSILKLAHVDTIIEALTLVRVSLQIPANAFARTSNPTANRYQLHRCRLSAFLLLCFLQRLVLQDNGYIPAFFEVLHFYKAALFRDILFSSFSEHRHLRSLRARLPDLNAFLQDEAHFQQPCVYLRISPWFMAYYIGATDHDVLHREHSRCRKFLQLQRDQHAFFEPALHYWRRAQNYWLYCAVPVEIQEPAQSVWTH